MNEYAAVSIPREADPAYRDQTYAIAASGGDWGASGALVPVTLLPSLGGDAGAMQVLAALTARVREIEQYIATQGRGRQEGATLRVRTPWGSGEAGYSPRSGWSAFAFGLAAFADLLPIGATMDRPIYIGGANACW